MNIALVNASIAEYAYKGKTTIDPIDIADLVPYNRNFPAYGRVCYVCSGRHCVYYAGWYQDKNGQREPMICIGHPTDDGRGIATSDIIQASYWNRYGFSSEVQDTIRRWAIELGM